MIESSSEVFGGLVVFGYGTAARVASFAILMSAALLSIPVLSSTQVSGGSVELLIYGYVKDQAGRPIQGAQVVVASFNGSTQVAAISTTTDALGFYQVTLVNFPTVVWDVGFTIETTAVSGGVEESESVTVPADTPPMLQIDIQFPFEISQFGSVIGLLAAVAIVGAVAVVLLRWKPRLKTQ